MKSIRSLCVLGILLSIGATSAMAQQAPDEGRSDRRGRQRGSDTGRRDRGSREQRTDGRSGESRNSDGGRNRGRGDRGGPSSFTPEGREHMYNHMVDRYVDRATRSYELTDAQKQQVRAQLEEVKAAQRAWSAPRAAEMQNLFGRLHQFHETERSGGQVDPAERQELESRLRVIREESPLMNSDRVVKEIEKVLPPEQVERGRPKWDAEHQESERRMQEARTRWDQRRQESRNTPSPAQNAEGDAPQAGAGTAGGAPAAGDRHRSFDRQHGDSRRGDHSDGGRYSRRGSRRGEGGGNGEEVGAAQPELTSREQRLQRSERPVGPWEQYVQDFERTYQLDAAQQATAESVLRELQTRRTSYEQSHRVDYDNVGKTGSQSLEELNKPVVAMFDELKLRLIRIPSSAQRLAAGYVPVPASRPAAAASQPGN